MGGINKYGIVWFHDEIALRISRERKIQKLIKFDEKKGNLKVLKKVEKMK